MDQMITQLSGLRLSGMAACWKTLIETRKTTELSLEDGLALLWLFRKLPPSNPAYTTQVE
ncbi:hypothetical protein [Gaoshiqia sp. Z1-71]|uniref:hypothetical protein n=1 Tax=Gaoshiqia hydrogeniformans TaxID=3290090 RepID=UPI003BF8B626